MDQLCSTLARAAAGPDKHRNTLGRDTDGNVFSVLNILSLRSGVLPVELKMAAVTLILKKPGLDNLNMTTTDQYPI